MKKYIKIVLSVVCLVWPQSGQASEEGSGLCGRCTKRKECVLHFNLMSPEGKVRGLRSLDNLALESAPEALMTFSSTHSILRDTVFKANARTFPSVEANMRPKRRGDASPSTTIADVPNFFALGLTFLTSHKKSTQLSGQHIFVPLREEHVLLALQAEVALDAGSKREVANIMRGAPLDAVPLDPNEIFPFISAPLINNGKLYAGKISSNVAEWFESTKFFSSREDKLREEYASSLPLPNCKYRYDNDLDSEKMGVGILGRSAVLQRMLMEADVKKPKSTSLLGAFMNGHTLRAPCTGCTALCAAEGAQAINNPRATEGVLVRVRELLRKKMKHAPDLHGFSVFLSYDLCYDNQGKSKAASKKSGTFFQGGIGKFHLETFGFPQQDTLTYLGEKSASEPMAKYSQFLVSTQSRARMPGMPELEHALRSRGPVMMEAAASSCPSAARATPPRPLRKKRERSEAVARVFSGIEGHLPPSRCTAPEQSALSGAASASYGENSSSFGTPQRSRLYDFGAPMTPATSLARGVSVMSMTPSSSMSSVSFTPMSSRASSSTHFSPSSLSSLLPDGAPSKRLRYEDSTPGASPFSTPDSSLPLRARRRHLPSTRALVFANSSPVDGFSARCDKEIWELSAELGERKEEGES